MAESQHDAEAAGVSTALDRTCALEARLRTAIQATHPLADSLERNPAAAEREREALLEITQQLELLEDKLREFRTLGPMQQDDKHIREQTWSQTALQTVTLSQLDSLRRELIAITRNGFGHIAFGKDVAKEVLAFAEMTSDAPVAPQPDSYDFPDLPPCPEYDAFCGSPVLAALPNGAVSPYRNHAARPTELDGGAARKSLARSLSRVGERPLRSPPSMEIEEAFSPGSEARQTEAWSPPPQPVRPPMWRSKPLPAAERSTGGTAASRSGSSVRTQGTGLCEDPSHPRDVDLYRTTNGSSAYPYDPEYGGKLSMRTYIACDENQPAPPPTLPEKPHIVDDVAASVMDDDGASMVSQYTIATVSHAGTRRGGRFAPAAMHAAVPEREVAKHRTNRRHGLRTVLCLALTAAAAYALRARSTARPAEVAAVQRNHLLSPAGCEASQPSSVTPATAPLRRSSKSADDAHYNLFPTLPPPDINSGRG